MNRARAERFKILIVDDTDANVLLLNIILKKEKYNTVVARNGKEALDKVQADRPDLILLDIMMPEMNGYEVIKWLKERDEYSEIPVIFLSALNDTADIVKGFRLGASDYISKPFNREELLIRVSHQVALLDAHQRLTAQNIELEKVILGRDKLYSVIAHDLRSPMGSVKMLINMLQQSIEGSEVKSEKAEMLAMANNTIEEMFSLLDNLLKWSKSQTGRLKTVYQEIEIGEMLQDTLSIFLPVSKTKGVNIQMVCDVCSEAYGDREMIKTILRNLLSNAIKYSFENGTIIVSAVDKGEKIEIHVQDFGTGIEQENQERLFKAEEHYTTYGTQNEEGSGLGLLLCRDFAERNGGELWFESKEGEGSTFSFSVLKKK